MNDWADDYYPNIGSPGGLHDLRDADGPDRSRLYGLKSVSKAAEWTYRQKPRFKRRPIGFHKPK